MDGGGTCTDREEVDDLTKEFLIESGEVLDCMERCLGNLQGTANNTACIAEIFRAVHTIKGSVGFLGFSRIEQLAHAGEALLAELRDGTLMVDEQLVDLLMQLTDRLRGVLQLIEERGHEGRRDVDDDASLIETLNRVAAGGRMESPPTDVTSSVCETILDGDNAGSAVESTVRVDVATLNRLMDLVDELAQMRMQFLQSEIISETLALFGQRLDRITADLRESVMHARMQPVGHLFQRLPRLARDVAVTCGKRVRLEFSGGETELDKSLLEALKDPLAHAVRNAIDHGIESPQIRFSTGKLLAGRIELRAFRDGGQIVVEVKDDGAGIDCEKVKRRAVERGLITADRAQTIRDAELLELLFEPGFSTSDEVTMISGRGVGMDVVRTNVERMGGSVELHSALGEGTTVRMRVPWTLTIDARYGAGAWYGVAA
jgi:two-component system chemotaxis sensor kinase CheA